jgi:plastocyanin
VPVTPAQSAALPYRGTFGDSRPAALDGLRLPPGSMPGRDRLRPLKSWRYVGVYGPELMLCLASVRIGPARQCFWAVWDRHAGRLHERTTIGRGRVRLEPGRAQLVDGETAIDLTLAEEAGVETICRSGDSYAWTRKQGGILATGTVRLEGREQRVAARAVIDDTAAYYERHTRWRWCAGVGRSADGRGLAWNLVSGVNDPPSGSERTVWVDGEPHEPATCAFAEDLRSVARLRFDDEATRERNENLLLVRSSYRQPFGTFAGELPGGIALEHGYGVMEEHDAWEGALRTGRPRVHVAVRKRQLLIAVPLAAALAGPASVAAGSAPASAASFAAYDYGWSANGNAKSTSASIAQGGTVTFGYPAGRSEHNADFGRGPHPTSCTQTAGDGSGSVPPLPHVPTGVGWTGTCTFNTPGTYTFHCDIHPFMTGTVVVQGPPGSPFAGGPSRALKVPPRQRGTKVRGSVRLSSAATGGRLEVDLVIGGKRAGRLAHTRLEPGTVRFSVSLGASARRSLARVGHLALTVSVAVQPPGRPAVKATRPVRLSSA